MAKPALTWRTTAILLCQKVLVLNKGYNSWILHAMQTKQKPFYSPFKDDSFHVQPNLQSRYFHTKTELTSYKSFITSAVIVPSFSNKHQSVCYLMQYKPYTSHNYQWKNYMRGTAFKSILDNLWWHICTGITLNLKTGKGLVFPFVRREFHSPSVVKPTRTTLEQLYA